MGQSNFDGPMMSDNSKPIYLHLLALYGANVTGDNGAAVVTVKGYPDWARPAATLPCVALLWAEDTPLTPEVRRDLDYKSRLGQRHSQTAVFFQGFLIARDEVDLLTMRDTLLAWHIGNDSFALAGQRIDCLLKYIRRHEPLTMSDAERYAADFGVQVTISYQG